MTGADQLGETMQLPAKSPAWGIRVLAVLAVLIGAVMLWSAAPAQGAVTEGCTTNSSTQDVPINKFTLKGVMAGCKRGNLKIKAIVVHNGIPIYETPQVECNNSTSCVLPTQSFIACTCRHGTIDIIVRGRVIGGLNLPQVGPFFV